MTIAELITLAEHRLSTLNSNRATAARLGLALQLPDLDEDIAATQATLDALRAIPKT